MTILVPDIETAELTARLNVAIQAALAAGQFQRENLGSALTIESKATAIDLVTHVDKACDAIIQQHLREAFPGDQLLTEETYVEGSPIDLSKTWVVDPLDGTTNYAHSFPYFAVSIAFCLNGQPVIGVIHDPVKDELFSALTGQGSWMSGRGVQGEGAAPGKTEKKPITVSFIPHLSEALLATGFPYDVAQDSWNNVDHFARMLKHCHAVRRPGAAALDLAYVACGRLEGFWELKLSPWDVAAGMVIVQAAGGVVGTFTNAPLDVSQRRIEILAANHLGMAQEVAAVLASNRQS